MQIHLTLADFAVVQDGKFNIIGGGWNITGPQPCQSAVAAQVDIAWTEANQRYEFRLELFDEDGHPVVNPENGDVMVQLRGEFEIGRPPGVRPGSMLDAKLAFPVPPLPLPTGRGYNWRMTIEASSPVESSVGFYVRPESAGFLKAS